MGQNPYTVNLIQFSGHGYINSKNEAICIVPEKHSKSIRIINFDKLAETFASKEYSINIFLFSACRSKIGKSI